MTSKEKKIKNFDPNNLGDPDNNIYGLPFTTEEAEVVIIPVPWEVTVSYGSGTAKGPLAVYEASYQVDLFDPYHNDAWKIGIAMDKFPTAIKKKSDTLRKSAEKYISLLEKGQDPSKNKSMKAIQELVNKECESLNEYVKQTALSFLNKNKIVGLLGGDHSTPLGLMQALSQKHKSFGILQIDAHADLRVAYEGFTYSHASIMYNALKIKNVEKLVQVGIRDYCEQEANLVKDSKKRIVSFYDRDIKHNMFLGETWKNICKDIVKELPQNVYVSFDIDGLDPKMCPNTGTPVAGGFEFEQTTYLIQQVVESGRKIIGFDVNEVTPGKDEWDANVGARLLYRIAVMAYKSNAKENKKALINYLFEFISEERKKRFLEIIEYRTRHVTVVLEDIFQAQNASAVVRTCDCFGIQDLHAIETKNKFDVNRDIALGSTQWLNLHKHKGEGNNTIKCLNTLKEKGYKIIATSPHKNGYTIEELPIDHKLALVFGTEQVGITDDVKNMADGFVTIPMFGFTESFNISVSAALALYTLTNRLHKSDINWKLTDDEKDEIMLKWQRNTIHKVELIEKHFFEKVSK